MAHAGRPAVVVAGVIAGLLDQNGGSVPGPSALDRVPKWIKDDLRQRSSRPLRNLDSWFPSVFELKDNVLHLLKEPWKSGGTPTNDDCIGAVTHVVVSSNNTLPLAALPLLLPLHIMEELMRRNKNARDEISAVQQFLVKNSELFSIDDNTVSATFFSANDNGAAQHNAKQPAAKKQAPADPFAVERRGVLDMRVGDKWFIEETDPAEGEHSRYLVFARTNHFAESEACEVGTRVVFCRSNRERPAGMDFMATRVRVLAPARQRPPPVSPASQLPRAPASGLNWQQQQLLQQRDDWNTGTGDNRSPANGARQQQQQQQQRGNNNNNGSSNNSHEDLAVRAQEASFDAALESLAEKSEQQLTAHKRDGCVVLIDHSYLVINGRAVAGRAARKGGEGDPRWRLSMDKLVDVVLSGGSAYGGARPAALLQAFGSVRNQAAQAERVAAGLAGVAAPGGSFLEQVAMETVARSGWTGKEKQVDHKIVRAMAMDLGAILAKRDAGLPCPDRTYCIVSGDGDFLDVVKMAVEHDIDVEVWCWSNSRANTYIRLAKHSRKLRVYDLDDFMKRFSFSETLAPCPPPRPPPGHTLAFCVAAGGSREDAQLCADRIYDLLQRLKSRYELFAGSALGGTQQLLPRVLLLQLTSGSAGPGETGNLIIQARSELDTGGRALAEVLAFPDFERRYRIVDDFAWTHVQSTQSPAALVAVLDDATDSAFEKHQAHGNNKNDGATGARAGGLAQQLQQQQQQRRNGQQQYQQQQRRNADSPPESPPFAPSPSSHRANSEYPRDAPRYEAAPAPEDMLPGQLLAMRLSQEDELRRQTALRHDDEEEALRAAREAVAQERCAMREFCMMGDACQFVHSPMERQLFEASGGRSPFTLKKTEYCKDPECTPDSAQRMFCSDKRHGAEKELCLRCLEAPCVGQARCLDVAESRPPITELFAKLESLNNLGYL